MARDQDDRREFRASVSVRWVLAAFGPFLALSAGAFLRPETSNAFIVSSGPLNMTVTDPQVPVSVDMDGNGTADFVFARTVDPGISELTVAGTQADPSGSRNSILCINYGCEIGPVINWWQGFPIGPSSSDIFRCIWAARESGDGLAIYATSWYGGQFIGGRGYGITGRLELEPGLVPSETKLSSNSVWFDACTGLRLNALFERHWLAFLRGDVGAGGSNFTGQWYAGGGYQFSWGGLLAGWRYLYIDRGEGSLRLKLSLSGPVIGANFQF
jgi:hypothetical protein